MSIVTQPAFFDRQSNLKSASFYKAQLMRLGINSNNVSIFPYVVQGDFGIAQTGAGTSDFYFPVSDPNVSTIPVASIATSNVRSFLHGTLELNTYVNLFSGGVVSTENWFATGPNNDLLHFLFKSRLPLAVDSNINSPENVNGNGGYRDTFHNLFFNFLRKRVIMTGAFNVVEVTEFYFNGIRIDY